MPVFRLAQAESRRMLLHPAFLVAVAALVVPWTVGLISRGGAADYPTLTNESWNVQMPMLLIVIGAFFSAHLTALRRYRFDTGEQEVTQPLPAWHQTAAQALAIISLAVFTGGMVAAQLFVLSMARGAAGSVVLSDAATAPACVFLAGVLGVAAAHVGRSLIAGILVFGVLGITTIAGVIDTTRAWRWLTLAAFENSFEVPAVPAVVAQRPSSWHLAWLLALAILVAIVAMFATGLARWPALSMSVAAALVMAITAVAQLTALPLMATPAWAATFDHPDQQQTCQRVKQVTYCAFEDFTSRIDAWASIAQAELDVVPTDVAVGPFYVRQRIPARGRDGSGYPMPSKSWREQDAASATPGAVAVSTRWAGIDDDSFGQTQVLAFGLGFAHRLVYGEPAAPPDGQGGSIELCGGPGIVTLWLAAGTSAAGRHAVETVQQHGDLIHASVAESAADMTAGFREATVLGELLKVESQSVNASIMANWSALTDPSMTTEKAATLLGVQIPSPISDEIGLCASDR